MARKSKLTDELIKDFCEAQKLGLSIKSSCDYCGITDRAYFKYMEQAQKDIAEGKTDKTSKFVLFFHSVKKANAQFRAYHILKIREASETGTWQASAWLLERCCPDEFGRAVKIDADNGILNDLLSAMKEKEED